MEKSSVQGWIYKLFVTGIQSKYPTGLSSKGRVLWVGLGAHGINHIISTFHCPCWLWDSLRVEVRWHRRYLHKHSTMAIRRVAANLGSICLFLLFLCVASTLCMLAMSPNFASAVYFVGTSLIFWDGYLGRKLERSKNFINDTLNCFPCIHLFSSHLNLVLKLACY